MKLSALRSKTGEIRPHSIHVVSGSCVNRLRVNFVPGVRRTIQGLTDILQVLRSLASEQAAIVKSRSLDQRGQIWHGCGVKQGKTRGAIIGVEQVGKALRIGGRPILCGCYSFAPWADQPVLLQTCDNLNMRRANIRRHSTCNDTQGAASSGFHLLNTCEPQQFQPTFPKRLNSPQEVGLTWPVGQVLCA